MMKLNPVVGRRPRHHWVASNRSLLATLLFCSIASGALGLKAPDVPTFRIRIRVISVGGKDAKGHKFPIRFQTHSTAPAGQDWPPWVPYDAAEASKSLALYPNLYLGDWPLVLRLQISGISDPTRVSAELS